MNGEEDAAVDTLLLYTFTRFRVSRSRSPVARLPRAIGGESGSQYIHRLLFGNRPDMCRKVLHLDRDAFISLVKIFIVRDYLKEGRFIRATKILAMSLFIFARGVSYREAEDRFQHCLSTVGRYHHQVLEGSVKSADVVRPYAVKIQFMTSFLRMRPCFGLSLSYVLHFTQIIG